MIHNHGALRELDLGSVQAHTTLDPVGRFKENGSIFGHNHREKQHTYNFTRADLATYDRLDPIISIVRIQSK
jgi:hypothetical protein